MDKRRQPMPLYRLPIRRNRRASASVAFVWTRSKFPAASATPPERLQDDLKEVEFYAATVTAWYGTAMELDRTVVTLSAAAIGLLVGLATTSNWTLEGWQQGVFVLALVSFAMAMLCLLCVFHCNKLYLQNAVRPLEHAQLSNRMLRLLDQIGLASFGIGAVLTISIAIAASLRSPVTLKEANMSNDNGNKSVPIFDSVNMSVSMRPDFVKSFNGATSMRPAASAAVPAAAPAPAAQSPSSATASAPPAQPSK